MAIFQQQIGLALIIRRRPSWIGHGVLHRHGALVLWLNLTSGLGGVVNLVLPGLLQFNRRVNAATFKFLRHDRVGKRIGQRLDVRLGGLVLRHAFLLGLTFPAQNVAQRRVVGFRLKVGDLQRVLRFGLPDLVRLLRRGGVVGLERVHHGGRRVQRRRHVPARQHGAQAREDHRRRTEDLNRVGDFRCWRRHGFQLRRGQFASFRLVSRDLAAGFLGALADLVRRGDDAARLGAFSLVGRGRFRGLGGRAKRRLRVGSAERVFPIVDLKRFGHVSPIARRGARCPPAPRKIVRSSWRARRPARSTAGAIAHRAATRNSVR